MEIALSSDTPGGFKHENALASQNGLALLASITLKNALNINNNNISSTKNNINFNQYNSNLLNQNNIEHHEALQPQHGFISSQTIVSSSSLPSSVSTEQKSMLPLTTADLQVLSATALSSTERETRAKPFSGDKEQQGLSDIANNYHYPSLSTNYHQTNNNTQSAKDPTAALLEVLSIKTNKKKQQSVSTKQQQTSTSLPTATTSTHSFVGTNGNGNGNNSKNSYRIPSDILDDLASRFIINVPAMELSNFIRICFQIELAHWFYLDFFCTSDEEKKLQPCGIKQFALQLFQHIPFLRKHLSSVDQILEDFKLYKQTVPTYGAILVSEDLNYCLLVQSYFAKCSWGFPKGKVNENEDAVHCAAREVYEETGYDITESIIPDEYIETSINDQYTRLYIVCNVSLETKFSPRTRNEIKCCEWFPIDSLPVNKNDAITKPKLGLSANSFFMIMPFVKRLRKWVNDKRNGAETRRKYSNGGSPTSTSPLTTAAMANGQQTKSSCKKQQKRINSNNFNDEINALYNNVGGGAAAAVLPNNNCSNSNSNRSKRQRHKSMGDLDVMKSNNCNNQSNSKMANNNNNNNCGSIAPSGTSTANSGGNISCKNNNINTNNNSNQKRNSKVVAAGCNASNTNNGFDTTSNSNNGNSSSKRQLFHSQSQTNNLQQNGEKIVSSFDLIRKEKQQMKAALAKAQNQQQNLNNNNGRQRAKSQSDKVSLQQQQQQNPSGNISCNKQPQRLQKQQSLNLTNTNIQNYNVSNNHHNNKAFNHYITKLDVKYNLNQNLTLGGLKTPTPPPVNGKDLLALAAAAAAVTPVVHQTAPPKLYNLDICAQQQQQQQQQKPRPSSVSLHFPEASSYKTESMSGTEMPKFERMASGTNLRSLKRSTSQQSSTQQQPHPLQRQTSALQFTCNSWTNFTFTKNFLANIFC